MLHENWVYSEVIRIFAQLEPMGTIIDVIKRMRNSGVPAKELVRLCRRAIDENIIGTDPNGHCSIVCKPANCKYCRIGCEREM